MKGNKMKTKTVSVSDIITNKEYTPLPLEVIPNYMGINLCSVDSITYTKQEDGQLVSVIINFIPNNDSYCEHDVNV